MKNFRSIKELSDYLETAEESNFAFKGVFCYFEPGRGLRCDPNTEKQYEIYGDLERSKELEKYYVRLS